MDVILFQDAPSSDIWSVILWRGTSFPVEVSVRFPLKRTSSPAFSVEGVALMERMVIGAGGSDEKVTLTGELSEDA
jgi:hypothetical protein